MDYKYLTQEKGEEWYKWGKEAYKSASRLARGNYRHPDYDTKEKVEAMHDRYNDSHMLTAKRAEVLRDKYSYTPEMIEEAHVAYKAGYDSSRAWYKKADMKHQKVLDSYAPLFKQAEEVARNVDVSDIRDGFPCGGTVIYLDYACRDTDLGKTLAHFNDSSSSSPQWKYKINIKTPSHGQCVSFGERVDGEVVKFLRQHNVLANVYSYID